MHLQRDSTHEHHDRWAIIAVLGLWLLLFTVGEIDFTIAVLIASGLLAVTNDLVGGLLGWGIERLVRGFFRR